MNKKLFLSMFAAAGMLLATSCSNDELDVVQSGNEAQVTFSLAAEGGIETRAISDGESADLLYYAIFDANGKLITTINGSTAGLLKKEDAFPNESKKDEVTVTLAKGQEYTAVFWAQDASCNAYTVTAETDGLKVAVDYEGNNNDETRDAFFKAETFNVTGNAKIDVELKRPFAQINVGVTEADWTAAVASGVTITESKVVIKNAATSINLLDGTVSGDQVVEYDFAAIPTDPATLEVDVNRDGTIDENEKYKYLSMSYILTSAERTTLESDGLQFTFKSGGNDIVFDEGLHQVPVQRNWRTNILGKLLTGDIQFNIVIDEIFYDDYNYPEFEEVTNGVKYDAATKTYYLYSVDGLKWLSTESNTNSNQFSGYTVKLTSDVDMTGISFDPIGKAKAFLGTFDGGNNTISNLTITGTEKSVGLFANARTVKNIKMSNVNITGSDYVGAIVGYGICTRVENCHVDGGTITANVLNKDGGAKVGGIVGYLTSQPDAWVKDCSVKNVTVKGYRDVGGIAGMAQLVSGQCYVDNVSIDNVTVIADMIAEYEESGKEANAGAVVGRNAGAIISNETKNNVTVNVYKVENGIATVGTAAGLDYATKNGLKVSLTDDLAISANETTANTGYGATGVSVKNGSVFDGNGNTITVNDANGTWDCAINPQNGTVKNLTVNGAFRGIFMGSADGDVFIDNVVIDNVCYTFNSDGGNKNYGVYISNSTLNGWTSFHDAHKEVKFTKCKFGKGSGGYSYAFCRPYNACVFENCEFAEGFEFDTSRQTSIVFKNCTYGGVKITAENAATLALGETTFFYNGVGSVSFQ
jgi:small nuclear ribonucleoprotein (snRNP)-like protein